MTDRDPEEPQRVVVRDKRRVDPSGTVRAPDPPLGTGADSDGMANAAGGNTPEEVRRLMAEAAGGEEPVSSRSPEDVAADDFVELRSLQALLDERTNDLQRLKAEFDNYRKRVERDRVAMAEQATAAILLHLLPVLDDVDRAREHGELTGGFKSVAEGVEAALGKLGLERFGDPGEPFDPMVHEAVMHATSAEVAEPTCVTVMRPGYRFGERLLRPAMVGVAEPEPAPAPEDPEPDPAPDTAAETTDDATE